MALKIVVLCGRAPRHLHVANRLCRAGNVIAVVQESRRRWTRRRIRGLLDPANVWRKLRQRVLSGGPDPEEARFFFGSRPAALDRPDLRVLVPHVNHRRVVELVERADPDVVAVYGTALIRPPLLGHGRLGMINLHPGVLPRYRGRDPTFWALYRGEPDQVGCSLHCIDAGVDTGPVLAQVCPEITPEDDDHTLLWKSVREGAEIFAELMERLERGERLGRPQEGGGSLYRIREHTRERDRELKARLAAGLLAGQRLPRRLAWFPAAEVAARDGNRQRGA